MTMPFPSKLLSTPVGGQGPVMSLTQHQWDCVNRCNEHFNRKGFRLPVGDGKRETAPLTDREKMFLSRDAYLRFLASVRGDISACVDKLERAIIWRRQHRIDDFDLWVKKMKFDSDMGKTFLCHFAPDGRPLLYMLCNRDQLPMNKRHPWLVLFCVERATELMANGQTALINIFPFTKKQGLPASVSVSRTLMSSMGNYYPEVLSRSYVLDAPWQIRTFIGLVWPMVDWSARRKIKICPSDIIHKDGEVPSERLLKDAGGKLDVPWDAEAYWETLLKTCRERRDDHLRRFRELGPRCGQEERLFKIVDPDPNETAVATSEEDSSYLTEVMSESTVSSSEAPFTPPALNAYTSEHGIKQWKDNWSFHGVKSTSPTSVRPNMTSASLESQYGGIVKNVQDNEKWLKTAPISPISLPAQRRNSIRQAESDAFSSNSGSSSSGSSVAGRTPLRKSSLRAPQYHPHANARQLNASDWTMDSYEDEEPQPRLYPRPPPPRSQKSFNASASLPMARVRTSSLEAAANKVTTRPLHQNGQVAATRAATEPGYPYRDEPALRLKPVLPRSQQRPKSREIERERKITDLLPPSETAPEVFYNSESDTDAESEQVPTPECAPDGMDAFTSRAHLGSKDDRWLQESSSKRSSTSTMYSGTSDGANSTDYLSSLSSPPRDSWATVLPAAMGSTSHLALEAQLEAQLQAQLSTAGGDVSNDDDATIRGSEVTPAKSMLEVYPPSPSLRQIQIQRAIQSAPMRSSPPRPSMVRGSPVKGPRSPPPKSKPKSPRSPRSTDHLSPGYVHPGSFSGLPYHESPPRLPQVQMDSWRFNTPTFGTSQPHPSWATLPRGGGKMRQASS